MTFLSPARVLFLLLALKTQTIESFVSQRASRSQIKDSFSCLEASRRDALYEACSSVSSLTIPLLFSAAVTTHPQDAQAGIDPSALRSLPVEGDAGGSAMRLRQIEAVQRPESDLVNTPWENLPDGIQYRTYREGKGDATVQQGSKVAVEATIRCKSFATANEPGGLKYFTTKEDTDFNELAFTVGNGEILPGLEEGMIGMRKGGLRRIEVPTTMVYAAKKANQLPLPTTKDGKRRFENLFKADATLIFEVLVTRIK